MDWVEVRQGYVDAHHKEFADALTEQRSTVLSLFELDPSVASVARIFERGRWDKHLAAVVIARMRTTAGDYGTDMAGELRHDFDPGQLDGFCDSSGRITAENINASTEESLQEALVTAPDERAGSIGRVFALLLGARLSALAAGTVTTATSLGRSTAAEQASAPRKRWHTYDSTPGARHAPMDGEEVDTGETFSNGLRWPGDPRGDTADLAHCTCAVEYPT